MPLFTEFEIGTVWATTTKALLEDNWQGISWELYFDDQAINLSAFNTVDFDTQMPDGTSLVVRIWKIKLVNPTPGKHIIHYVSHHTKDNYDGFDVYKAGTTYESVVNLTLTKPSECQLTTST